LLIMGIDPGTAITGYGVIEVKNNNLAPKEFGCVRTNVKHALEARLAKIYEELIEIMQRNKLNFVVVEQIFFNKNTRTAMAVGQARGVALLAAAHSKIPVVEYTPLQVKQALVGYGRAYKVQVQDMVRILLNLEEIPQPDDVADALGLAICHAHRNDFKNLLPEKGWGK